MKDRNRIIFALAILAVVFTAVFAAMPAKAETSGTWGTNLNWTLSDAGLLTVSGTGEMESFSYYSSDAWLADKNSIKSVVIEEGVTSIGDYAFNKCNSLESIEIPVGVTSIGIEAFYHCYDLENIEIPAGVTSIGHDAFSNCYSLESITIPASVTSIEEFAFESSGLKSITIPASVTSIGKGIFFFCLDLKSVVIPDSVTSIEYYAFDVCPNLESVVIPDGVTSIGNDAFYEYTLLYANAGSNGAKALSKAGFSFRTPGTNYNLIYLYTNNEITGTEIREVDKDATHVEIPDGVTSIGDYAFRFCSSLESIKIPDNVTSIGEDAFYWCPAILYANAGSDGAKALSKAGHSFRVPGTNYNLIYLYTNSEIIGIEIDFVDQDVTHFEFPAGVTSIGDWAFSNCSDLASIEIPAGVTSIGDWAFSNCSDLASIEIPTGVTSIGVSTFGGCNHLRDIVIPGSVKSIGEFAFVACTGLTNLEIPEGVTSIGSYAFSDCSNLVCITIPDSVSAIRENSFNGCSGLTNITIGSGVESIEKYAFQDCSSLKDITIPDNVTTIGKCAFLGCGSLAKVMFLGMTMDFDPDISVNSSATIYCHQFSDVDYWADSKGYTIVYLETISPEMIRTASLPEDFRMARGDHLSLGCPVFPTYDNPEVIWTSDNESVVSVMNGVLTALSAGEATITATAGDASDSVTVTVYIAARSFSLTETEYWLVARENIQLEAVNLLPAGAEMKLTWSSSDTNCADVSAQGLVTTRNPGDVVITAVSERGIKRECILHICYPVSAIEVTPADVEIEPGDGYQIIANVTMQSQSCVNHLVSFTSSHPEVAEVDQTGHITAKKLGIATITIAGITSSTASASVQIRVGVCAMNGDEPVAHDWGAPTYNWAADHSMLTATRICGRNEAHIETETVEATEEVLTAPTCEEPGLSSFAAEGFENEAFSMQREDNVETEPLGHDWGKSGYNWAEDNSSVTAIRICDRDKGHVETETAECTKELLKAPTETEEGLYRLHGGFRNEAFSEQTKELPIPALSDMNIWELPGELKDIPAGAFMGSACEAVVIPQGCRSIGAVAFADCPNLRYVYVPDSVTSIEEDAFAGSSLAVIDRQE